MKKLLAILLSLVLCFSLFAACSGGGSTGDDAADGAADDAVGDAAADDSGDAAAETKTVAIQVPMAHPYCSAIIKGAQETLEAAGCEVIVKEGDGTSDGQLADIEDFVVRGVDAIILFPWDSSAVRASLDATKSANIPVFVVDNPIADPELVVSEVATDNYLAGVACAEGMIEDLGGKGKIVVLDTPENNSSLLRANGFVETLEEKAPDIEIVSQQNYNADQTIAMNLTEDILQTNPDINAMFVCNEPGAFGAFAALEAAGKSEDVKIYTVDGSKDGVAMVKEGKIAGIAAQQPELMGSTAAEQALKYFAGEETTPSIALDVMYVNSSNSDSWEGF